MGNINKKDPSEIFDSDFTHLRHLENVVIPDGTKSIAMYAFYVCHNTRTIRIPNSVVYIGKGAFEDCTKLLSVNLPSYLSIIDEEVFAECSSLQHVILPRNLKEIRDDAFRNCKSLKSIFIPYSVVEIGRRAFAGCVSLMTVSKPEILKASITAFDYLQNRKVYGRYICDKYVVKNSPRIAYPDVMDCVNLRGTELFDTALLAVLRLMDIEGVDDGVSIGVQLVVDFVPIYDMTNWD